MYMHIGHINLFFYIYYRFNIDLYHYDDILEEIGMICT